MSPIPVRKPITVDYDMALELASHEGLVREAYRDSVGVLTWGFGITSASGHDVSRYLREKASYEQCIDIFVWALEKYAKDVRKAFGKSELTREQFAAALSFHYNTGGIRRATWVKKFKAGKIAAARRSFMDWRKPPEIVPRRKKERDLFFDGVWSNNGFVTEYTRLESNGTPDWSSGKRVDLASILDRSTKPILLPPEKPKSPGIAKKDVGIIGAGLAALGAYFHEQILEFFDWIGGMIL